LLKLRNAGHQVMSSGQIDAANNGFQ
jgi:hypothetical protein